MLQSYFCLKEILIKYADKHKHRNVHSDKKYAKSATETENHFNLGDQESI